ncbi:MAG TPA: hypothetical protein VFJ58_25285 [Armatimonadota bacterium]|nr:hypothetical protein [Armatimonadota bacterium]
MESKNTPAHGDSGEVSIEPEALVEISNTLFKRFTAAQVDGEDQVGMAIEAAPEDLSCIGDNVREMLVRVQIDAVVEETSGGIVIRRKTEAD